MDKSKFNFSFYNQWGAIFNQKENNWIDFSVFSLEFEFNKLTGFELRIAILGFSLNIEKPNYSKEFISKIKSSINKIEKDN